MRTILLLAILCSTSFAQTLNWYKGNTHTHTINSDGDSTPADVAKWYRENHYNFLFITDHEHVTNVAGINELHGMAGTFIVISGQEVTDSFDRKPLHMCALGVSSAVMPNKLPGTVETLQKNINDVIKAGGIAQINHPNFGWALSAEQLIKLQNYTLLEVHNGHPLVNNLGGGGVPGAESLWDSILTSGKIVFGVADDDSHNFKRIGDPTAATPGRGWIYVRAAELTPKAIMDSLRRGDFYASTGVELSDYRASEKQVVITIKEARWSKYRVQFIGRGGRVLSESITSPASYIIKGDEGYVRAKVYESNGKMAWTQPVMLQTGIAAMRAHSIQKSIRDLSAH
ncbi:MAG: CehA/McbA family metallohydrolase [Pyrinomonadaceae bacterium]